jgi:lactoylglutathione lyase
LHVSSFHVHATFCRKLPSTIFAAMPNCVEAAGVTLLDGPFLDFRDLWGNRVEIVGYDNIQFTKAPNVLRGMGLMHLAKTKKLKRN